jgi:alpha-tubulin suppressor-like RCC1 family protein
MSSPSNQKKRYNEAITSPTVSFSPSLQKVQRDKTVSAASSPGKKLHSKESKRFLKNQEASWQQHMEALNEHTIKLMLQASSSEAQMLLAADHLRCQRNIEALYKLPPGLVVSMGQDDCAQLGISTANEEEEKLAVYPPTLVKNVTTSNIQVAAGGLHSLALAIDGKVYSWGCNDDGALGRDTEGDLAESTATLIDSSNMDADGQGQVTEIRAGDSHSIYKTRNGDVYQSGMYKDVDSGKFRDAPPGESCKGSNAIPTKVQNLTKPVKSLSCGASFNAAILADDTMVTWGT